MGECVAYFKEITLRTSSRFEVIRITDHVEKAVRESGIRDGFVVIHAPHATAAIIVNEYEPRIVSDYLTWIRRAIPPGGGWRHDEIDDNAHAHIASAIIGATRVLPVRGGRVVRGTWQEVMLVELDGPRYSRRVLIEVIGTRGG